MNDKLREAAERHRRYESGEVAFDIWGDGRLIHDDTELLADAYLAEHPADDDEPVIEGWINSELRIWDCSKYDNWKQFILHRSAGIYIQACACEAPIYWTYSLIIGIDTNATKIDNPTRGQVRRLISALKGGQ